MSPTQESINDIMRPLGGDGARADLAERDRDHALEHCRRATVRAERLEDQGERLREALECWPLKELVTFARNSGNGRMWEIARNFEEIRLAALGLCTECSGSGVIVIGHGCFADGSENNEERVCEECAGTGRPS